MSYASLSDAAALLPGVSQRVFYGGRWVTPSSGEQMEVVQPSTGEVVTHCAAAGVQEVDEAVHAAKRAWEPWRATPALQRGRLLRQVAGVVRENAPLLAALDTLDTGAPFPMMLRDAHSAADRIDYFAGLVTEIKGSTVPADGGSLNLSIREPLGVVARMGAYNHPLLFSAGKMAAPLAAGNTVILKPADATPLSTLKLAELLAPVLPEGVLGVLTGTAVVGQALVAHRDVAAIGLVGGVETGRSVMRAAADQLKPLVLELGGKNALVAYGDCSAQEVAAAIVRGMNFEWAGQSCGSTSRAYVHRSIHEEVVRLVVAACGRFVMGDPFDPLVTMGPLVSHRQLEKVQGWVDSGVAEGAVLRTGGARPAMELPSQGFFHAPTVLDEARSSMRVAREEIFGPVVCILPWNDEDTVWSEVNGLDFGLTCSIWTRDVKVASRAAHRASAGYVWINAVGAHYLGSPFGGFRCSGIGREESIDELIGFTQQKNIYLQG